MTKKNYNKILSDALGFTWDKKIFEVHHINHNHDDNELSNLLLVPKNLHNMYHSMFTLAPVYYGNPFDVNWTMDRYAHADYMERLIECEHDLAFLRFTQNHCIRFRKQCDAFDSKDFYFKCVGSLIHKWI